MFAWFEMWPLAGAMAASGVFLIASPFVYRLSGSIVLGRESFLVALFAFKYYEIVYFGTILSPGSLWMVALPVIAIMVGSIASSLVWMAVTLTAIVRLAMIHDLSSAPPALSPAEMNFTYAFSLVYLIVCLSIFVLLVDYERRLAIIGLAAMNEKVGKLSISDPLTGLFNRRHLGDLVAADDARSPADRAIAAVVMIDIDRFKSINDRFGHLAGDIVIRAVAEAIGIEAGSGNPVGRFGGEEFLCLVQTSPASGGRAYAGMLAEAIRRHVAGLVLKDVPNLGRVTVSIGFAECARFENAQATIAEADFALYAAKEAGRDCIREAKPRSRLIAQAG